VILEWSCTDGGSGVVASAVITTVSTDGAEQAATGTCADHVGNSASDTRAGIDVDTTAPTVETPVSSVNPKPVAQWTSVTAAAADGLSGLAGGELFVGADPGPGQGTPMAVLGTTLTATIGSSLTSGVYTLCVRSRDRAGNWSPPACAFLVVYDPTGAFVTGSGRIDSPAGAYRADLTLSGRADFGFVSKYKQGATTPSGNTRFQFKTAGFDFNATSYDWLVVAGARAQFKGRGIVNGAGDYGFLLTAIDGDVPGGGGVDRFRIKVWDRDGGGAVVYDNQPGAPDDADATTASDAGAITIHKG